MAPKTTTMRFTEWDQDLLANIMRALDCSQTEAVRWGLIALRALMVDGDMAWQQLNDGRRVLNLRGERGHSLTLVERANGHGKFYLGAEGLPGEWGDE